MNKIKESQHRTDTEAGPSWLITENTWFVAFFWEASFWASENYTWWVDFESHSLKWWVLSKCGSITDCKWTLTDCLGLAIWLSFSYKEVSNNPGPQRIWRTSQRIMCHFCAQVASLACCHLLTSVTEIQTDKYKSTKVNKIVVVAIVVTVHHS